MWQVDENEETAEECQVSVMPTFKGYANKREVFSIEGADEASLRSQIAVHASSELQGQGQRRGGAALLQHYASALCCMCIGMRRGSAEISPDVKTQQGFTLGRPESAKAQTQMRMPQPLSVADWEDPIKRYSTPAVLRALLMHNVARGGVPIKFLSARWLLTYYQANPEARLEHRQHLERIAPEAFMAGAKLERLLAGLASGESQGLKTLSGDPFKEGVYMTEVGGEYKAVMQEDTLWGLQDWPLCANFPSAVAISHMCATPRSDASKRSAHTPPH